MADPSPSEVPAGSMSSPNALSLEEALQLHASTPDTVSVADSESAAGDPPSIVEEELGPPTPAFIERRSSFIEGPFDSPLYPSDTPQPGSFFDASTLPYKTIVPRFEYYEPTIPDQTPRVARLDRARLVFGAFALALVIFIVVGVTVPLTAKHHYSSHPGTPHGSGTSPGRGGYTHPVVGVNGTKVTTDNGTTFIYVNNFGGFWYDDPKDPYSDNAQAQLWTPPLRQPWDWQHNKIRGVNLGGWLVLEPFITPALFERYVNLSTPAVDEYTLSQAMAADTAHGGLAQLEQHYDTFITEEDFANIAGAGLNWIRLPIPFWAVQIYPGEPFLEGVAWTYVLKALKWARKYGLRVNLDLHTVPGSQNGFIHSGKEGSVNFLHGVMGIANAQRTLDYLRVLVEFVSQPEYANIVLMVGVVNEPLASQIGIEALTSFYLLAHDTLRNVTGYGEGHGPYISIHDGFLGLPQWASLLPGHDRLALDIHPSFAFVSNVSTAPLSARIQDPCTSFAAELNTSWTNFGVTTAGEWSLAINDCGLWLNGVNKSSNYETQVGPGSCGNWTNYANWTASQKQDLQNLAFSWVDSLQNWFFWTWKIDPSSVSGRIESPLWSYSLGLENGWIPLDPRHARGACGGGTLSPSLKPSMTGGPGAGTIPASVRAANPWPPNVNPNGLVGSSLPSFTATGPIPTLPAATGLTGWFNQADTRPMYTPIAGCSYPNEYDAVDVTVPPRCTGTPAP